MSFGKKLTIAFAVMLVATMAVGTAAWIGLSGLAAAFEKSVTVDSKKLEISGDLQATLADITALEHRQVLSVMGDNTAKAQAEEDFIATSEKFVSSLLAEGHRLVYAERGKHDLTVIEKGLAARIATHAEFWKAVKAGQPDKVARALARRDRRHPGRHQQRRGRHCRNHPDYQSGKRYFQHHCFRGGGTIRHHN